MSSLEELSSVIQSARQKYAETGRVSDISNEVKYLMDKGYTTENLKQALNIPSDDATYFSNALSDLSSPNNDIEENSYYDKDSIIGMPFRFNALADPRRRVYNHTFLQDPCIVSIIPGLPEYRTKDPEISAKIGSNIFKDETEEFLNGFGIKEDSSDGDIATWLLYSQKSNEINKNRDLRYYGFRPNLSEFLLYLNVALGTVATKMGINTKGGMAEYRDYVKKTFGDSSIKFWCEKSISLSESVSNDFGQSSLASTVKTPSDLVKEAQFLFGTSDTTGKSSDTAFDTLRKVLESPTKLLGGTGSNIRSLIDTACKGYNMIYPDIWKDSSMTRNYGLQFKFVSPYGTPQAIFEYVYFPFLVLLTLAMPRQYNTSGYMSPFICRVDIPGFFTTDCAAITNMSWTKGGDDNLYTYEGLPLSITVNIEFKDLYPMSAMPKNFAQLRHNTGMHGFFDNMAALPLERLSYDEDVAAATKTRMIYSLGKVNRFGERISDFGFRITHPNITSGGFLGAVYKTGATIKGTIDGVKQVGDWAINLLPFNK